MKYSGACVILVCVTCLVAPPSASAVTIDWVPVGNAGNANDFNTGNLYGGVAYNYSIDKYDVTVGQYTEFLNAVATTDTYGLYNTLMGTNLNIAGISRSGSPGSYTYSVIGNTTKLPITYVSWGDAARFANWLQKTSADRSARPGHDRNRRVHAQRRGQRRGTQCRHAQRWRDDLHSQRK
jgi:hypothetical protein